MILPPGLAQPYRIYTDQNPPNAPWQTLILLEYSGLDTLSRRDEMKQAARQVLGADADFKRFGETKLTIRKEQQASVYVPILAP